MIEYETLIQDEEKTGETGLSFVGEMQTKKGMSGGPIYYEYEGKYFIVGIHSGIKNKHLHSSLLLLDQKKI